MLQNMEQKPPSKHHRTRMMWYFDAIIDWMIANPGRPLHECATHIGRTPSTLSMIINSDIFKAALAERKANFQTHHDFGIIEKTTRVAHASLDAILDTLEKKRDKIPLGQLKEVSDSALQRLGYGIGGPAVQVNVQNNDNRQVTVQATASDIEEARMALRQVQGNISTKLPNNSPPMIESEAESVKGSVSEVSSAPTADAT